METKYPSPDGSYIFQIFPWEARMSLWIESPQLIEAKTGQTVLRFNDSNWSLDDANWLDEARVQITLRKYPGDHSPSSLDAVIDCRHKTASIMGAPAIAVTDLEWALNAALRPG